VAGILQCRQGVDEAGGEPPQAAVAEAGIRLQFDQPPPVDLLALDRLARQRPSRRFITLLTSERPIRNSIDR